VSRGQEAEDAVSNPLSKCHRERTRARPQFCSEQGPEFRSEKGRAADGDLEAGQTCAEVVVGRCDHRPGPDSFTGISPRFRYRLRPFRYGPWDRTRWFQRRGAARSSPRSMSLDSLRRLAGHVLRRPVVASSSWCEQHSRRVFNLRPQGLTGIPSKFRLKAWSRYRAAMGCASPRSTMRSVLAVLFRFASDRNFSELRTSGNKPSA
jgi:hypothetical protein